MGVKARIKRRWNWRRNRTARRIRERIYQSTSARGWSLQKMKAAAEFIMAAPRKDRKLREELLMKYNLKHYNHDGLNPPDPVTGLRTRKVLLVEGYILRSEIDTELLRPTELREDYQDRQEEEMCLVGTISVLRHKAQSSRCSQD